jgi:hypothetical protein
MNQLIKSRDFAEGLVRFLGMAVWNTALPFIAILLPAATAIGASTSFNLSLQDAPLSIPRSSSITRKLVGVPFGIEGKIYFEIKWHVNALLPTYNSLKIELLHGSAVLKTNQCYSFHSDKTPKCSYDFLVTQTESLKALDWKLRITNSSTYDVSGFNVQKELTDLNPLVLGYRKTVFAATCTGVQNLWLSGLGAFDIPYSSSVEQALRIVSPLPGVLNIKAKWYTEGGLREAITPTYLDLKLSLFNDSGSLVKETTCFSFHSPNSPKCSFTVSVPADTDRKDWKLRIENRHFQKITGFYISKDGDMNPAVPSFVSTFTPTCS